MPIFSLLHRKLNSRHPYATPISLRVNHSDRRLPLNKIDQLDYIDKEKLNRLLNR